MSQLFLNIFLYYIFIKSKKRDSYKLFISVHEIMSRKENFNQVLRAEITKLAAQINPGSKGRSRNEKGV